MELMEYENETYENVGKTSVEGSSLRVATVLGSALTIHEIENDTIRIIGGYEYEVLKYIIVSLNLSISAIINAENFAPSANTTANTNSDVGTILINKTADISISVHEFNPHRASTLSYLHPTLAVKLFGFFIQPPKSSIRNMYFEPFKIDLWIAMLFTWGIILLTAIILIWTKKNISLDMQTKELRISEDILLWALAAGCQHGWLFYPESVSLKIIFFCALLTGLIIYLAYSAALVSVLALDVIPIKNVPDMFSAKYDFFGSNLLPGAELFMDLNRKQIKASATMDKYLLSPSDGVAVILKQQAIFLDFEDDVYTLLQELLSDEKICSTISKLSVNQFPTKAAMLVNKGSPFKEEFNIIIVRMINTGMLRRLRRNHEQNTILFCLPKSHHQNDALDLNDVFHSLAIFLFIHAIGLICFVLELFWPCIFTEKQKIVSVYIP